RKLSTRRAPVVFDQEMAAGLLGNLCHAASGYALYKGASFLIGQLGKRLAPEFVTIYDNGRLPGGLGSRPFDGEGLPTRKTTVVERGMLTSYLLDTYSGRKLGLASTGNAYPVEEITIAGNLKQMFADIEVVGSDLEFRGRIASPTIKIREMMIAGT